jgi:hypothetical protein
LVTELTMISSIGPDSVAPDGGRQDAVDRDFGLIGEPARQRKLLTDALHFRNRLNRRNRRGVLGAEGEGQLLQLALADLAADRGRFGVDERRDPAHLDRFGDPRHRHARIDAHGLPRFDAEGLGGEGAEAGELHLQRVESLRQVLELERAAGVSGGRPCETGLNLGERDGGAGQQARAGVDRLADNGSVGRLRVRPRGPQKGAHHRHEHTSPRSQHAAPPSGLAARVESGSEVTVTRS